VARDPLDLKDSIVDMFLKEPQGKTVMRLEQEQQRNEKNFLEYLTMDEKLVIVLLPRNYRTANSYTYRDSIDEYARYLNEIANGAEKKIKVTKYDSCSACDGTGAADPNSLTTCSTCRGSGHVTRITNTMLGQMQTTSVCPSCGGEGKTITRKCSVCYGEGIVQKEDIIKISIPAGVGKGMQMTVSGKGNAPRRGGINGDLLVVIDEEEHQELIREGKDLIYNLFISIPDAVLGSQVEVPTVENNVKIKIEPGIQPGKILRLKGKGLPEVNGYGRGDLLVNVNVWIPKNLSREELKIIEKFKDSGSFTPKPDKDDKGFFERMRGYFQ